MFTTHTPVPAGSETYPAEEVVRTLAGFAAELGIDPDAIVRLGRSQPDDGGEPFGVTQFSLRMSRAANGVSRRHGGVAREMWRGLWPERPVETVPMDHVTNGMHLPTWVGAPMRRLLDRHLGAGWSHRASDADTWEALDGVPDAELWAARCEQRVELVELVKDRSGIDRLAEHQPRAGIEAAARAFDPDVLTLGFARRNATYKRLGLLTMDPARALGLLAGRDAIQIVLAGKAHPSDDEAKRAVQELFPLKDAPHVAERVVYLHEYDLGLAAWLVRGCDVWVNLPRPPLEASGTSGMKVVVNGGLHLSVLDGWWAEAYDGTNGWALSGDVDSDHAAQDARDAAALYDLLEREVVPTFYDCDADGSPAPGSPASAPRCARSRPRSAPGGCSTTTSSGFTRPRRPVREPAAAPSGGPRSHSRTLAGVRPAEAAKRPKSEKPKKPTTGKQRPPRRRKPDRDGIAKRAHEISRSQGDGDHVANWLQAERELSEK